MIESYSREHVRNVRHCRAYLFFYFQTPLYNIRVLCLLGLSRLRNTRYRNFFDKFRVSIEKKPARHNNVHAMLCAYVTDSESQIHNPLGYCPNRVLYRICLVRETAGDIHEKCSFGNDSIHSPRAPAPFVIL